MAEISSLKKDLHADHKTLQREIRTKEPFQVNTSAYKVVWITETFVVNHSPWHIHNIEF